MKRFAPALLLIALVVAALLGGYLWYLGDQRAAQQALNIQSEMPLTTKSAVTIGGPFTLTHHSGDEKASTDLPGDYQLIYFGYSYCPDICPTSLGMIITALNSLPEKLAQKITPVFVTIDPERDTAALIREYVTLFDPRMQGFTGSPAQIETVKDAYKVYAVKRESDEYSDYLVDHSSYIFFMRKDGTFIDLFPHDVTADEMAKKIGRIMRALQS